MTLVVLAIVLNTVIFTQNLATREAIDSRSSVEFVNAAEHGIGGAIATVNNRNAVDYTTLDDAFRPMVTAWADNVSRLRAGQGVVTSATLYETTNGTRVVQNSSGAWTNASGTSDWTMASGIDNTRRFHANVNRSSLVTNNGVDLPDSNAFRINVSDGTDTWSFYVYGQTADSDVVEVTAITPTGGTTTCTAESENVTMDLTEGSLNGSECGFDFASGVTPPYTVTVDNGTNAAANYTFVVNQNESTFLAGVPSNTYHSQSSGSSPFTTPAIYSATLNLTVDSADVAYTNNVTIAPETVPGGETY